MASIGATTTHSIKVVKKSGTNGVMSTTKLMGTKKKLINTTSNAKKKSMGRRGSVPPRLLPEAFATLSSVSKLKDTIDDDRRREMVSLYLLKTMGEPPTAAVLGSPKTASTTRDRSSAAADLAILTREFGIAFVLKQCGVLEEMKRTLLLNNSGGIDDMFFARNINSMKPSSSTASLASLESNTQMTIGTDTKRGKTTPAVAREGSLLLVRALAETLQPQKVEPYLMMGGFLAAALDECGSSHSSVRQAAEDASSVLIGLLNGYSLTKLVFPLLMMALENSTEWRVKHNALERLAQCAKKEPIHTHKLLPTLIPLLTTQVWDTKPQVTKAAASTLLAVCQSNVNPDIAPAIPAVCRAIGKPSLLTHEAISELMHTTFVAAVEAPTLAILCPVLARGLKENRALTKRAACLVISNMSRLVDQPDSVAPFGPLLVPELTKVAQNVQFEEIRDAALEALANLTKALGYAYNNNPTDPQEQEQLAKEEEEEEKQRQHDLVKEKQFQIELERLELAKKLEAQTQKEQEERKQFKLAMEAQRQLDKHQEEQEAKQKQLEAQEKEKQKLSTKGASGKCQGCGLKKCKKTCLFYSN